MPVLALWLASALVVSSLAYGLIGRSTNLSFDRILADDARALGAQLRWRSGVAEFVASQETADSLVFDSLARAHYLIRTVAGRDLLGDLAVAAADVPMPKTNGEPAVFDLGAGPNERRAVAIRLAPTAEDEPVLVIVAESKAAREQVSHETAQAIFASSALVGLIIVPLLFVGLRRGLAPTRRISAEAAQHGVHDLSPLPVANVPEELRGIVEHTNELLARLRASITEQRRFIADAAHQLQTPVAGIRLLVGDMRRVQRADPAQPVDAQVLAELDEVALRAARLVRQLLAFARAEDAEAVEDVVFDVAEVLREVEERWRSPVAAAGKSLHATVATARVRGSPTLLGEVLSNLVDNALRYGGPRIGLHAGAMEGEVVLAVEDDGPALPAEVRASMLLPFWRGEHGHAEGSGLGLSIASRVVQRMQGRLHVGTGAGGQGTRIEVRLPVADGVST